MQFVARTKVFLAQHERLIMPATLLVGFIIDYLTLNRVDQLFDNIVLLFYVLLAATSLFILYGTTTQTKLAAFAPYTFQYAIGGLFSGLFIFYFRSGTLSVSFPFLIILLVLMLGSDYFYKRFPKASFQLVIFFIALLSYVNLVTPIITKHLSVFSFIGATLIASALMYVFIMILDRPRSVVRGEQRKKLEMRLGITVLVFATLYFTNIIPPLPLSMKAGVIGYDIQKTETGNYNITTERAPWYTPFNKYNNDVHTTGPVYAFSSIFAPTQLETRIFHEWQRYDTKQGWITTARVPISIVGGRAEGFRGYSFKNNLTPGTWRVDVVTARGQVIGRLPFTVTPNTPQHRTTLTY